MKYRYSLALLFILACSHVHSQAPFYNDIQNFKTKDSLSQPPLNAILFVGSSSFTKWTDVQQYFPNHTIINRGFGGSTLPDVIRYANDIIFPYHSKQIVIYCGENDLASSDTITAETVFDRFKQLYGLIRNRMPDVNIVFISIKPSPSRYYLMPKMKEANQLINNFLSTQNNASFADVRPVMLNEFGKPKPVIFTADSLHMNANGYALWQKVLEPYL